MREANAYFFFWTGQFMYIGKAMDTSVHDHHAIQIALSFDHPFSIKTSEEGFEEVTNVIIDTHQQHECRTNDNTFLFLNIDPMSNIGKALKQLYLDDSSISRLPVEETTRFLKTIEKNLAVPAVDGRSIYEITQQYLYRLCALEALPTTDERIQKVMRLLEEKRGETLKQEDLAATVFLSPGRLTHLFKEQVGIPIRKYVLWLRILLAVQKVFEAKNIREAALYAGFTDAPHFNRTFRKMFGLYPSSILKNSQNVQAFWN